jgi:AcrR family transcriptional regulator
VSSPTPPKTRLTRRGAKSGYPAGDGTKSRIISTGIIVFGQRGFVAASTREIAARSGVKPPALLYYFGSKLGLYRACIESVTTAFMSRCQAILAEVESKCATCDDLDELIDLYCRFQDVLLQSLFIDGEGGAMRRLWDWENLAQEMDEAHAFMREHLDLPIFRAIAAIVGRISGRVPEDLGLGIDCHALIGMFAVFALDSTRVFNALGWRGSDPGAFELLKPILRRHATLLLTSMASDTAKATRASRQTREAKKSFIERTKADPKPRGPT